MFIFCGALLCCDCLSKILRTKYYGTHNIMGTHFIMPRRNIVGTHDIMGIHNIMRHRVQEVEILVGDTCFTINTVFSKNRI